MATGAEQTRRRLLTAAAQEILEHGFAAASLSKIARRLDLTKGAFGHHFPTKRAILVGILDDAAASTDGIAAQVSVLFPQSPLRACVALFAAIGAQATTDPVTAASMLMYQDPSVPPEELLRTRDAIRDHIRRFIDRSAAEEGYEFALDADDMTAYLQTLAAGMLSSARFPERYELRHERDFMILALRGAGVSDAQDVLDDVLRAFAPAAS